MCISLRINDNKLTSFCLKPISYKPVLIHICTDENNLWLHCD